MQVFKAACKIILKHPVYLVIYIVLLSFLGLAMTSSLVPSASATEYQAARPRVAVIDRDDSILTRGLAEAVEGVADIVVVEDNTRALQDAVAQELVHYILIIPEDYEKDYINAIESGKEAPLLQNAVSAASVYSSLMDQVVDQYFALISTQMLASPTEDLSALSKEAVAILENTAQIEVVSTGEVEPVSDTYAWFLKFSCYPLTAGIIVCISVLMIAFNKPDLRRRNNASPSSALAFNMQIALGCVMVMLFAWVWINVLASLAFGSSLTELPLQNTLVIWLITLCFVTVPLAIGFLFNQLGIKENAANAAGNILAMVMSFLGGAWIDIALLGKEVVAVAHFTPTFWYADALDKITSLTSPVTGESFALIGSNILIMLLFSAAIFVIAMVVGRYRKLKVLA